MGANGMRITLGERNPRPAGYPQPQQRQQHHYDMRSRTSSPHSKPHSRQSKSGSSFANGSAPEASDALIDVKPTTTRTDVDAHRGHGSSSTSYSRICCTCFVMPPTVRPASDIAGSHTRVPTSRPQAVASVRPLDLVQCGRHRLPRMRHITRDRLRQPAPDLHLLEHLDVVGVVGDVPQLLGIALEVVELPFARVCER